MSTWTKEDQQRYFHAMERRENRQKRNRVLVASALFTGIFLLALLIARFMFES